MCASMASTKVCMRLSFHSCIQILKFLTTFIKLKKYSIFISDPVFRFTIDFVSFCLDARSTKGRSKAHPSSVATHHTDFEVFERIFSILRY
jgi:hypothetical protein